jgi:hypothetical protein
MPTMRIMRAAAAAHEIASARRPNFITNYIEIEAHAWCCESWAGRSPASGS